MLRSEASAPVATPAAAVPVPAASSAAPSPRFYVCVGLLVISAAGMQMLAERLGGYFRKEAVALKRPLDALDWEKLAPEYRQHLVQPAPMNDQMEESLGTREYLQVRLVDTGRGRTDPARVANVFVTYYTGQPDMVPHVPDECYLAGGYDPVGRPADVQVTVRGVGAPRDQVPLRLVQFHSREREEQPTAVLYFFHVNGEYKTTRDEVRLQLANPFVRHAYYAKIELTFMDDPENPRTAPLPAGREESLAAAGPLLQKLLPVLLADHFAWDQVLAQESEAREPKTRG